MASPAQYQRFGTPGGSARERFDFWRTWYAEAVVCPMRLEPVERVPADFRSSAEQLTVGDVSIIDARSGPAIGSWRRDILDQVDDFRVNLWWRGPGVTGHWYGRETSNLEGTTVMFDRGLGDGWWRAPAGQCTFQVNVPRSALAMPDATIDRITRHHRLPDQLAHSVVNSSVVQPLLRGMVGRIESLARTATPELADVCVAVVTMLMRSLAEEPIDSTDLSAARRLQAGRFINANLSDPHLGPEEIAAALHVSRRTLYRTLAANGQGVAAMIRDQRLRRAHAMLADPRQRNRSIAEIGAEIGLPNPAHFGRLFRARYGESPREFRGNASRLPNR